MPASGDSTKSISPWLWVPTLYFAQGLPNGLLEDVAPALFKDLGVANDALTHALSLAAIPWMLKALWSPVVDTFGTKRRWVWAGQAVCALAFAAFVATPFAHEPVRAGLAVLTLVALCSATHDIAADGFYLFGVRTGGEQAFFSGIRGTTFRLAKVFSATAVVGLAAWLMNSGNTPTPRGRRRSRPSRSSPPRSPAGTRRCCLSRRRTARRAGVAPMSSPLSSKAGGPFSPSPRSDGRCCSFSSSGFRKRCCPRWRRRS
jgi:hypothetical protein